MLRQNLNTVYMCDKVGVFGDENLPDPRMVGMMIGDGTYGKDKTPRFFNCDDILKDYVKSRYNTKCERSHITKDGKLYEENYVLGYSSVLRQIGIYGQTKTAKRLPDNYLRLNEESAALMLAGIYDTDGYIDGKRRIVLTQSSREILEQIQLLLRKFGIWGNVRYHKPCIKPGRKDKNGYYDLDISDKQSVLNFYQSIPLLLDYKKKALENMVSPYKDKLLSEYNGMRTAIVQSVEKIGKQRIYNLTANDSHTYLANDFITHNTGGDSGPNLAGLAEIFSDPEAFNVLPYKNNYTADGKYQFTGFFIPAYAFMLSSEFTDSRGVTNRAKARA